jgi:hypothetical protein
MPNIWVDLGLANIFVGAKHDRKQFISSRQRFTAVMLRLCKIGMLANILEEIELILSFIVPVSPQGFSSGI